MSSMDGAIFSTMEVPEQLWGEQWSEHDDWTQGPWSQVPGMNGMFSMSIRTCMDQARTITRNRYAPLEENQDNNTEDEQQETEFHDGVANRPTLENINRWTQLPLADSSSKTSSRMSIAPMKSPKFAQGTRNKCQETHEKENSGDVVNCSGGAVAERGARRRVSEKSEW